MSDSSLHVDEFDIDGGTTQVTPIVAFKVTRPTVIESPAREVPLKKSPAKTDKPSRVAQVLDDLNEITENLETSEQILQRRRSKAEAKRAKELRRASNVSCMSKFNDLPDKSPKTSAINEKMLFNPLVSKKEQAGSTVVDLPRLSSVRDISYKKGGSIYASSDNSRRISQISMLRTPGACVSPGAVSEHDLDIVKSKISARSLAKAADVDTVINPESDASKSLAKKLRKMSKRRATKTFSGTSLDGKSIKMAIARKSSVPMNHDESLMDDPQEGFFQAFGLGTFNQDGYLMFHPYSQLSTIWDFIMFILNIVNAFIIPLNVTYIGKVLKNSDEKI